MSPVTLDSVRAASVLRDFTGPDALNASFTEPVGGSGIEPGITPNPPVPGRLSQMLQTQCGQSRIIGDVLSQPAINESETQGTRVAAVVWAKAQTYFNRTAAPLGAAHAR